jgi:hypothetical protein
MGSTGLMLRAGQNTPRFLLFLFVIWLLSPFVTLAWANVVWTRWPVLTRVALYTVSLIVTLGSLAIYGDFVVVAPVGSANAFVWVVVPPVSWLLMTIVVSLAALISRRRQARNSGP